MKKTAFLLLTGLLVATTEVVATDDLGPFHQDEIQALCSRPVDPPRETLRLEEERALQKIPLPPHGRFGGQIARGQAIAYGTSKSSGNCVGCHRLQKSDIAYGTLGPDLLAYGKNKRSEDYPRVWKHLYDAKAFHLCSAMPRFGTQHILTDSDLLDVMSFLLDPDSPVNQ